MQFTFGIDSFLNVAFKVNLKNAKCFFSVTSNVITLNLSYLVYFFISNYGELIVGLGSLIITRLLFSSVQRRGLLPNRTNVHDVSEPENSNIFLPCLTKVQYPTFPDYVCN